MARCVKLARMNESVSAELGEYGAYRITEQWRVIFDEPVDVADACTASLGNLSLPEIWADYDAEKYPDVICLSKSARPNSIDGKHFTVTVQYATNQNQTASNPLLQPVEISFGVEETVEDVFKDVNGKRFATSAGETFDQFLKRRKTYPTIILTRNESSFDPVAMAALANTVNADTVTIDGKEYIPGSLRMRPIRGTRQVFGNYKFYRVTIEIVVDHVNLHKTYMQDMGIYQLNGTSLEHIKDVAGLRVTKPWPLDGMGKARAKSTDDPASRVFEEYMPKVWQGLNLQRAV